MGQNPSKSCILIPTIFSALWHLHPPKSPIVYFFSPSPMMIWQTNLQRIWFKSYNYSRIKKYHWMDQFCFYFLQVLLFLHWMAYLNWNINDVDFLLQKQVKTCQDCSQFWTFTKNNLTSKKKLVTEMIYQKMIELMHLASGLI